MASEYRPNFGVIPLTASTAIRVDAFAGKVARLANAAGLTVTLPPATGSGARFEFVVSVAVTSNQYRIDTAGTDKISGLAHMLGSAAATFAAAAASNGRINMNGTTTGGLVGTRVMVEDIGAGLWSAVVHGAGSGTAATPFADK